MQLSKGKQGLASDAILSRLMRLSVETGAATASVACVELVLFLVYKHNNAHLGPYVPFLLPSTICIHNPSTILLLVLSSLLTHRTARSS